MSNRIVELRITGAPADAQEVHDVLTALLKGAATLAAPQLSTRRKYAGSALGRGQVDAAEIQKVLAWRAILAQLVADQHAGLYACNSDYFCCFCDAPPDMSPDVVALRHEPTCPIILGRAFLTT